MLLKYELIRPPNSLNFHEFSNCQANAFYTWYLDQIPLRINKLTNYIRSFPGYESWNVNNPPTAIKQLDAWYGEQVTVRNIGEEETKMIYSNSPEWFQGVPFPNYDLTPLTISLSVDIGMYISQTMLTLHPEFSWKLIKKPKNAIDYNQPALIGRGKIEFYPIGIILTYTHGIAKGNKTPGKLEEIYNIWTSILLSED